MLHPFHGEGMMTMMMVIGYKVDLSLRVAVLRPWRSPVGPTPMPSPTLIPNDAGPCWTETEIPVQTPLLLGVMTT